MIKRTILSLLAFTFIASASAQDIKLPSPSLIGGTSFMETLWQRQSIREYSPEQLSDQDLSDLMFAASGINRPESGKITSPTALNRQEIDLYVFLNSGVFMYDKNTHSLVKKAEGDHRDIVAGFQDFAKTAPVCCVLVANLNTFGRDDLNAIKMVCCDAGIMSENISLFCASRGIATVPRATMDSDAVSKLLNLSENEMPMLNHPVGYPK